jgi:predicted metalloprotease with PDZ domain
MVMSLTPELRTHFGARDDRGVLVAHVEPGTPAATAGLHVGDVIVEVRGQKIDDASDVLAALADQGTGQKVEVAIVRDGKPRTLDATLTNNASAWANPMQDNWFRDWFAPLEQPPASDATASNWLRHLREMLDKSGTSNRT